MWRVAVLSAALLLPHTEAAAVQCASAADCSALEVCGASKLCSVGLDHTIRVQGVGSCADLGAPEDVQSALDHSIGMPVDLQFQMECATGCVLHGRTISMAAVHSAAQVQELFASKLDAAGYVATSIIVARDDAFSYVTLATDDVAQTTVIGRDMNVECTGTLDMNVTMRALVVDSICHAATCVKGHTPTVVATDDLPRVLCQVAEEEGGDAISRTTVLATSITILGLLTVLCCVMLVLKKCGCKRRNEERFDDFKRAASARNEKEMGSFNSRSGSPVFASFRLPASPKGLEGSSYRDDKNGNKAGRMAPPVSFCIPEVDSLSPSDVPSPPHKEAVPRTNPVDVVFGSAIEEVTSDEEVEMDEITPADMQGVGPACGCCLRRFVLEEGRLKFDDILGKGERGLFFGRARQYLLVGKTESALYCLGCRGSAQLGQERELATNVHRETCTREALEVSIGKTMGVMREKTMGDQAVISSSVSALFKGLPKGDVAYSVTKVENGEPAGPGVVTGCRQTFTRWFYRVKKPLLSWLCVIIPLVGAWLWYFFNHTQGPAFDLLGYSLPIAKGCANAIKVCNFMLMMMGCRHTMTAIQSTALFESLFGQTINLHVWLGVIVTVLSLIHTGCASRNYYMLIHKYDKNAYDQLVAQLPFITGILCMVLLLFPVIVARYHVATRKLFNFFFQTHMFLILYMVVLLVHTKPSKHPRLYAPAGQLDGRSDTIWWTAPPLFLYLAEMLYRRLWRAKHPMQVDRNMTRLYPVGKDGGRILRLSLKRADEGNIDSYKAGQYVHIQDERISRWEWHPFTVSKVTASEVELQIKCDGDWVTRLGDHVETALAQRQDMALGVDGPYIAPAQSFDQFSTMVLVGAGIGVTPFLSVAAELLKNKARRQNAGKRTRVHFIYLVAELEAVSTVEDVIRAMDEVKNGEIDFTIQICLTGPAVKKLATPEYSLSAKPAKEGAKPVDKSVKFDMFQLVQHYTVAVKSHDFLTHLPVATNFGRPSWREIFTDLGITNTSTEVGVFCCGNPMLVADLEKECKEFNSTYAEYDFRPEIF